MKQITSLKIQRGITHFFIVFICLISLGCKSEWDVLLYQQKIEGSPNILYKYDAWGGRDSEISGFVIKDSIEKFDVNVNELLPIGYLVTIPDRKSILFVKDTSPEDVMDGENPRFIPIETINIENKGIFITTYTYQYKAFAKRGQGYNEYHFENFKETRDSLYFYNLDDVVSMEKSHLDILRFKKPNIFISRKKNSEEISEIRIEDLKLTDKHEIISKITYDLTPKKHVSINEFSDYGIFKEVIEKKANN